MSDKKDLTNILELAEKQKSESPGSDPSVVSDLPAQEFASDEDLFKTNEEPGSPSEDYSDLSPNLTPNLTTDQASDLSSDLDLASDTSFQSLPEPKLSTEEAPTPELEPEPTSVIETNEVDDNESAPIEFNPMDQVKAYSERVSPEPTEVQASIPYTLLIEGKLTATEKEKILDIISRENMGFREIDLEPQFAAGKILLPRMSEYAGIYLIQKLRDTQAKMTLKPSDDHDTDSLVYPGVHPGTEIEPASSESQVTITGQEEGQHPAELLPITPLATIPHTTRMVIIDAVTASASLQTTAVEAQSSSQYQELVDNLQRELKYKAYRKGATAIVNFSISLTPLSIPSHYKLLLMGTAVKAPPTHPHS